MKKFMFLLIFVMSGISFGVDPNYTSEWVVNKKEKCPVLKLVWAAPTAIERFSFDFSGTVLRVVVDVTTVDADGDIVLEDVSDANYVDWSNKLGSGDIDYVVKCTDVDGNVYGGVPVAGGHSGTLTDCAGAGAITMYIYFKR